MKLLCKNAKDSIAWKISSHTKDNNMQQSKKLLLEMDIDKHDSVWDSPNCFQRKSTFQWIMY